MIRYVGTPDLEPQLLRGVLKDRRAKQSVAEKGAVIEFLRERFPNRILFRKKCLPVDIYLRFNRKKAERTTEGNQ
jgi:hypothetical protein